MTDEELKALVAENSRAMRAMQTESEKRRTESEKRWAESEKRWEESRQETERIWQEILASREETKQEIRASREETKQEIRASREESERIWQEVLASRKESDRVIDGLHRELGRLGNVLGVSVESVFRPSLDRILRERFGMTSVFHLSTQHEGQDFEVDLVGHAGDEIDEVYLVEVKNQLREDGIQQLLGHLRRFPRVFPEHRGKKLFGILAAITIPENLRSQALKEGLYLVTVKDDVFELTTPDDFEPRAFGLRSLGGQ